jgi:transcriptional regulator with XRE-family HTH domain
MRNAETAKMCRSLRASVGWTVAALATAAGVSRPTIDNIESGTTSPTYRIMRKIEHAVQRELARRAMLDQPHVSACVA